MLTNDKWAELTKLNEEQQDESEINNIKMRTYLIYKFLESVRVLFDEFTADTNLDIREKARVILKIVKTFSDA